MSVQDVEPNYLDALRGLPCITPSELLAGRHLVVVAPHPDDESLGMGGLLAAAQAQGTGVTVVFLTDGEASHVGSPTFPPARLGETRRVEATRALAALGIPAESAHFFGLGDSRLPYLGRDNSEQVMKQLREVVPGSGALVCVTSDTDAHGDHRAASILVRRIPWPEAVEVMHFPVWTWHVEGEHLPAKAPAGYRVDVRPFLDAKRAAIASHRSQHGEVVHDAAEAFELEPGFVQGFLGPTETLTWPT